MRQQSGTASPANPWSALPGEPPYVLPADKPGIDAFNRHHGRDDRRLIRLDIRPEPYIGLLDAPIVLLYLNPGYTLDDQLLHRHQLGEELWRSNIDQSVGDYPFYMLDPRIEWASGARWWRRTLSRLIALTDERIVARSVLAIEYFPYHSQRDPRFPGTLRSQEFGFRIVDHAVKRGAVVLVTRSGRAWREHVASLSGYPRAFEARSPQQAMISAGNYPEAYPHIIDILNRDWPSR